MNIFDKKANNTDKRSIIMAKYNKLAILSSKAQAQLEAFNTRYRSALSNRVDLDAFLDEEEAFIDALIKREEESALAEVKRKEKIEEGYAALEAHTNQLEQRISKYKPITLAGSNNEELMRLFGAIDELDRVYWSAISKHLREVFPIRAKSPLEIIENQLAAMVSGQAGKPPAALAYYCDMIRRGESQRVDDAAFGAIKEAAFFLNDTIELLNKADFPEENEAMLFLKGIITDFRVKDIKRRKD
jgi:hypothetical protein